MSRIVMAGLDGEIADWLKDRLGEVPVDRVSTGHDALAELERGEASLLILDGGLVAPSAIEVLKAVRARMALSALPVIYCFASGGFAREEAKQLVRELGVREVLFHPIDPPELARQAARVLGAPLAGVGDGAETQVEAAIVEIRSRFFGSLLERIGVLERAGVALLERKLSPVLREEAEREAHRLAGAMGTLGFAAGSRFAREAEDLLREGARLSESRALRFSELVVALRLDVSRSSEASEAAPPENQRALLVVDRDVEFAEKLAAEAASRGFEVDSAQDWPAARREIAKRVPDAVLLELSFSGRTEDGLAALAELASEAPPVPAVVLTSKGTFTDRVEVARHGGHGFVSKSTPPAQIMEAVEQLLERSNANEARIMAVDDDPQMLAVIRTLLEPRNLRVLTLNDPLQFWDEFEKFAPDLLVLDVDMPHLSGVELCRVVRNDFRWAGTPVIFLTRHNDAETIQRVFSAGADDFVAKPIVGPELLTRISNRLERLRLRRSFSETDPLTGALNRRKSSQMIADFMELARQHHQPFSLAVLDVERLAEINSRHGYAAGDTVLQRVAGILQDAFRSQDVFARWSGGIFVAGMYGLTRYDGVQRLAGPLAAAQKQGFSGAHGSEFNAVLSAGVAQYGEDGTDLDSLYKAAEAALKSAQAAGGGKVMPADWCEGKGMPRRLDVALVMRDEAQASLLAHTLESRGCRSRWFPDGKIAHKVLGGAPPGVTAKVILVDVDLPGFDGLSLLKRLAWDGVLRESRVIMLTAPSVSNEARTALELGAFDYIVKPFNPPVAAQHIRRALEPE
ncbi:MAG: response regulator [Terriglobia bacterium]